MCLNGELNVVLMRHTCTVAFKLFTYRFYQVITSAKVRKGDRQSPLRSKSLSHHALVFQEVKARYICKCVCLFRTCADLVSKNTVHDPTLPNTLKGNHTWLADRNLVSFSILTGHTVVEPRGGVCVRYEFDNRGAKAFCLLSGV